MMIHHVVTIILLYFSWVTNFPRLGCVIILIHDVADSPMAVSCLVNSLAFRFCQPVIKVFFCFCFSFSTQLSMELILLINVKIPTIIVFDVFFFLLIH